MARFELAGGPAIVDGMAGKAAEVSRRRQMDEGTKVSPAQVCTRVQIRVGDEAAEAQDVVQGGLP
jgi:hypothetical protein